MLARQADITSQGAYKPLTVDVDKVIGFMDHFFIRGLGQLNPFNLRVAAKLLLARKAARESGDQRLEHVMLEAGKVCDVRFKNDKDDAVNLYFHKLLYYLKIYDDTQSVINQIVFAETVAIDANTVMMLNRNRIIFDMLDATLFERLFVDDLMGSAFIDSCGRKKAKLLFDGLARITEGTISARDLVASIGSLENEERLLTDLLESLRDKIRNGSARFASKGDLVVLKRLLTIDLRQKGVLAGELPEELFLKGLDMIKKEAIYVNNLLPLIMRHKSKAMRAEFLAESGLDLVLVEELEHEYCDANRISRQELLLVR